MNTRGEKRERLYGEFALENFSASSALEGIDYTGSSCRESVSSRRRQLYQSLTSNPKESATPVKAVAPANPCTLHKRRVLIANLPPVYSMMTVRDR